MSKEKNDYNGEDTQVRKTAIVNFWNKMRSDPGLRAKCTDTEDLDNAIKVSRQVLKEAGNFQDDPDGIDGVEVRVFEHVRLPSDKLVTLVIPPEDFNPNAFDPAEYWRCSWNLWKPGRKEKK